MCQYDTDVPTTGHPHPHEGILQKMKLKKRAITLIIIGRFYPKSSLTYILWLYMNPMHQSFLKNIERKPFFEGEKGP